MDDLLTEVVLNATGATRIVDVQTVQSLWSGYGKILRVQLAGEGPSSVIVKHVSPPTESDHPRGWATDFSHQRKLRSYKVESAWYRNWSCRCDESCRVAECFRVQQSDAQTVFVIEDLNEAGFAGRRSTLDWQGVQSCLHWLASFHATFLASDMAGLWPSGTYWHLATRPDEWSAMDNGPLKTNAHLIDQALRSCQFRSLVHGDAKVANFCFSNHGSVAAVDFQYVGGGCGMKDVAYFLGSCLSDAECDSQETELLDCYFKRLTSEVTKRHPGVDAQALEMEWRSLYCLAWADFHRFLAGWCPGHQKLTRYSQRMTEQALASIQD